MMTVSRVLTCVIVAVVINICSLLGQSDNVKKALVNLDYQRVIAELEPSNSIKNDAEALFVRGQAYAELGLANKALPDLARAKTLGLKDPNLYKYLGKTYQLRNRYDEAIKWYKLYLENLPKNSKQDTEEIYNLIKQSNNAENIPSNEAIIVQHCDGDINSIYDEVRPIFSRTASNKLYYSYSYQEINSIRGTEFLDGAWSTEANLPSTLNAVGENSLNDISGDGQVLFFNNKQGKKIYSLYNKLEYADKNIFFQSPYFPHLGDKDLQVVDQNTIVFASLRPDSYGGYDIYMSKFKAGKWTEPTNLGDDVNSTYDDCSPFMTADGKQLYFSSNRIESLGGFDIFQASRSVVESKGYNAASNLGAPINSAGDDLHFRVDGNGLRCTFNSNRIGGKGGLDIYLAYLNTPSSQEIVNAGHLDYIKYETGQLANTEVEKSNPKPPRQKTIPDSKTVANTELTTPPNQVEAPTTTVDPQKTTVEIVTEASQIVSTQVEDKKSKENKSKEDAAAKASKDLAKEERAKAKQESKNAKAAEFEASKAQAKLEKDKKAELDKEAKRLKKEAKIAEKKEKKKEEIKYVDSAKKPKTETLPTPTPKVEKNNTPAQTQAEAPVALAKPSKLQSMIVPTIYYADEDAMFSIANRDKLDTLARYFTTLPSDVILELTNFTHKSPRKEYELFFSINQLDAIVEYLQDKGVDKNRLIVNSVGSSYPLAEANLGGNSSNIDLAMNQRIEATYYNVPSDVSKAQVRLDLPLSRQAKEYPIYKSVKNDVHYRLEFAETSHIFKNRVLNYYNDIIITRNLETQNYLYALGFFQTYNSVLEAQKAMAAKNLPNTEIVAYNGSQRLNKTEVLKLAATHASLRPFMDKI